MRVEGVLNRPTDTALVVIQIVGYKKRLHRRATVVWRVTVVPRWTESTSKHGVTRADATYVLLHPVYRAVLPEL